MLETLTILTFLYAGGLLFSLKMKGFLFSPLLFLLAFGAVSYYLGSYDIQNLLVFVFISLIVIWILQTKNNAINHSTGVLIPVLFLLAISVVYLSILMRYPVPPGADSALHLFMVNSKNLSDPYPQSLHVLMNAFKVLLNFGTRDTFIVFQYIMVLEFLYWVSLFFVKISKKFVYVIIGLCIVMINPSFFNNIINGAITHNLGIVFITSLLVLLVYRDRLPVPQQTIWYFILTLGSLYSHSITFVILIAITFLYRFFNHANTNQKGDNWFKVEIGSLILSIPLYFALEGLGFYHWFLLAVVAFIFMKEAILRFKFANTVSSFLRVSKNVKYMSILGLILNIGAMFFVAPMISWNGYLFGALTLIFYLLLFLYRIRLGKIGISLFYFHIACNLVYIIVSLIPFESLSFSLVKNLLYFYISTIPIVYLSYKAATYISPWVGYHLFLFLLISFGLMIQLGRLTTPNSAISAIDPYIYSKYTGYTGFGVFADSSDIEVIKRIRSLEEGPILNVGYLDSLWIFLGSSDVLYRKGGVTNLEYVDLSALQYSREIYLDDVLSKYPKIRYVYIPHKTKVRVITYNAKLRLIFNSNGDSLYEITFSR